MSDPDPLPRWDSSDRPLRDSILDGLLDRLPAAVYIASPGETGRWLFAGGQVEAILGLRPDELVADPSVWARHLHPSDRARVLATENELSRTGRIQTEYRMIRPDGQIVWVLDDSVFVPESAVQHGLLYDISDRRRTELLLAEHTGIVDRVARGDDLEQTLVALAASTEAVSGTGRCIVEVEQGHGMLRRLTVSSGGPLTAADRRSLGATTFAAEVTVPSGVRVGQVSLHYPYVVGPQDHDCELAGWAAGLASVAVVRATEHSQMALSLSLLEATLGSTADGILVVNSSGRIVGHNQRFLDMWRIDSELLRSGNDEQLMASVLNQLADPQGFLEQVRRLYATPTECTYDEVEFRDGRFFERYSQPQWVDGCAIGRVWSFRDMTLHRQLAEKLRGQAFTDSLTPLANRAYFLQQLTAELHSTRSEASRIAVLLLDLDDFKTVNDSLGHIAGDQLLMTVAQRLRSCLGSRDIAGRLGGDEFVVLLADARSDHEAGSAAERILAAVEHPVLVAGQIVMVRASVGIAIRGADEDAGDLLRNADLAMYRAKRDGGGRCHQYQPVMHAEAVERLALKADLDRALESEQLVIHYQPVVNVQTSEIVGVEALLRWPHPTRGLIMPSEFVPLAEESRLIDRLGRWVLREACAQAARWRRTISTESGRTMSVNLSPRQLSDPHLVEDVRHALWISGLPASSLVLEITESSLALPSVDAVTVLRQLKEIGVVLALDDFGTGYSSLGHLVNYPLDMVKIDKSFVEMINDTDRRAALLTAVLGVADALSLETTIEGIENISQLERVRALGCTRAQGYLLSEPLDADAATRVLSQAAIDPLRRSARYLVRPETPVAG